MVVAIKWPPLKAWHDRPHYQAIRASDKHHPLIIYTQWAPRSSALSPHLTNLIDADNKRKHTLPLGRLKSGGTFPRWILFHITLMICSSSSHLLSRFQTQRLFHTEGMCLTWLHSKVYIYGPRGLKWSISHQSLTPGL